jgi:hypothetical protein
MNDWLSAEEEALLVRWREIKGCGCHNPHYWCSAHSTTLDRAILIEGIHSATLNLKHNLSLNDFIATQAIWDEFIGEMRDALGLKKD